jgi:hypothetical protein
LDHARGKRGPIGGLGTLGLHEPKLRELGTEAGFASVRRIPMDNPFNSLYELTP